MKKYKYNRPFTYNGRRYWVRGNTLAEVALKKALRLRDLSEGKLAVNSAMTLRAWAERCVGLYKTSQSEVTRKKYWARLEACVLRYIGSRKLKDIKTADLQAVMNEQLGKSKTQVNEVYQALRFLFRYAVNERLISEDPSLYVIKPRTAPPRHRRALSPAERELVARVASGERRFFIFLLMLYCGCRPSEAIDCTGNDIVVENGVPLLHIRGRKTTFSERFVPIPDLLLGLIKKTPKNEYIAVYSNGNKITPDNMERLWASFKRACNIALGAPLYKGEVVESLFPSDLVPYCLRHEFCTDLARKGVDIRTAQRLMGHSNISTTANIYTNLTSADTAGVASLLGATAGATDKQNKT